MKLAAVIATKDRPKEIRTVLSEFAKQSVVPDQIIVMDSSATPQEELVCEFPALPLTVARGALLAGVFRAFGGAEAAVLCPEVPRVALPLPCGAYHPRPDDRRCRPSAAEHGLPTSRKGQRVLVGGETTNARWLACEESSCRCPL